MLIKKNITSLLIVIAATLMLHGCASQGGMTADDRVALSNLSQVRVLYYGDTYPSVNTAAGVLAMEVTAGLSIFGEDWTLGQKMMKKYNVPNPTRTIRNRFLRQIKSKSNIKKFVGSNEPQTNYKERKMSVLKAKYKSGVILQIMPGQFQIWYYPASWGKYLLRFTAYGQMMNLDNGKVMWRGFCNVTQKTKKNRPSMKDLTAENSTVLKNWVNTATEQCSEILAKSFLKNISANQ